ncbi:Mu transposase C-terminal domain-containing protein [[Bacillus] enclensis]|uniref:Mu transposase C-terminal domain-containing protein n=1 Tax=[Bacillus] enclensis TaxID=1402860 RepID=UPI0018DBE54A|nr:Mu transposase C-terminal domain-containing protein [[Bacillus] enclensis]MBH9968630.1 DDE-type integrase/transposase/recombinase [[Bacillus] enclensis]
MKIYSNEILVNVSTRQEYRILWIDSSNKYVYLIDINDKNAFPVLKVVDEIIEDILQESLIKERKSSLLVNAEEGVSNRALEIRDRAWKIIKDVVSEEPEIYISEKRGQLIKELVKNHGISKTSIYKYLRKYWQRGKSPNALIADYNNSGGKGKSRVINKKVGRPSKFPHLESKVIVNEQIKKFFRITLQKYYFNTEKNSLPFAHKMMVREFFAEDIYFENGKEKLVISNHRKIPTINQLRYFLKTEYTEKQKTLSRVGKGMFERHFRELLGSSTFETFGPGSRFQIDATIGDVYLISEYNSDWIIGRPVIYLVIDVFSRLVVGLYVGLEGPSWFGAMMAIANSVSDKEQFCKQFDINISKQQWPAEHLPQIMLADRGEFEGYNSDRLNHAFSLHVENAAPFRADWKGIVEKYFDIFQGKAKPFLPGYVDKDFNERGARDYRLDAKLTIKDLTKILIAEVIYHNNHHYLKSYPRDEEMINDGVEPIPIQLWNWGIQNRSGKLTYHSPDTVKLHLLPQEEATVTERGIRFRRDTYYSCEKAIKDAWFSTARIKGVWKVKVAYDSRNMNQIFLLINNGREYEVCNLVERDERRYKNKTLEDIEYKLEMEKLMLKTNEHRQLQSEVNLINQIEEVVISSTKKANESQNHDASKSQKVSSISDNRYFEKNQRREQEIFRFSKAVPSDEENTTRNKENNLKPVGMDFKRKDIKEILEQKRKDNNE